MLTFDASTYKIVDYLVTPAGSYTDIGRSVRDLLEKGWEPYGPLVVGERGYAQAMIKLAPRRSPEGDFFGDE